MSSKKLLTTILIVGLGVLAFVNYQKRMQLATELQKLSVQMEQLQTGNNPENVAEAARIVEKVRAHMQIDPSIDPTVATIVDVDALRTQNEFYANAKNGDFLIVTPTRAILYDPDKDMIIDVVPVQLQNQAEQTATN